MPVQIEAIVRFVDIREVFDNHLSTCVVYLLCA